MQPISILEDNKTMEIVELDFNYYSHLLKFEIQDQFQLLGLGSGSTLRLRVEEIHALDDVEILKDGLTSAGRKPNGIRVLCTNVSNINAIVKQLYFTVASLPENMVGQTEEFPIKKGEFELFAFVKRHSDSANAPSRILGESIVFRFGSVRAAYDW